MKTNMAVNTESRNNVLSVTVKRLATATLLSQRATVTQTGVGLGDPSAFPAFTKSNLRRHTIHGRHE